MVFETFKRSFAKLLANSRSEITLSDVLVLCQPLAAEEVVSEPIIWSAFANIVLSVDIDKLSLEDVIKLAWSMGKV